MKKDQEAGITVFLADAVIGAKAGQKTSDGYYNIERMLERVLAGKGQVLLCSTCMDARGLTDAEVMPGAKRSTCSPPRCWTPTRCWYSDRLRRRADDPDNPSSPGTVGFTVLIRSGMARCGEFEFAVG